MERSGKEAGRKDIKGSRAEQLKSGNEIASTQSEGASPTVVVGKSLRRPIKNPHEPVRPQMVPQVELRDLEAVMPEDSNRRFHAPTLPTRPLRI